MKNSMKNFRMLSLLLVTLLLASCSSDDPIIDGGDDNPPVNNELSGDLNEDLTLDPDVEYHLTGQLNVLAGAKLTIPAGTKIITETGTNIFIAVYQDAKIDIRGTANEPVVMTSENGNPGDWGGLLLMGNGITTAGINATAEVGQLIYGGTDNTDSSGSINYLVIVGAGAQINADSQYNGLTLYAVGSGTSIKNVALLNGADDGVEFFGGAVSVSNLYLENNEDDSVDWTEGWNGTITDTYVLHTIEGFSTAIEADGINGDPKIINFTAISTTGGTALQFKKESGATISGLYLEGYETNVDMANEGPLANVLIAGAGASLTAEYKAAEQVDIEGWIWVDVWK